MRVKIIEKSRKRKTSDIWNICRKTLIWHLWFSFVSEPDFDDREDGGDAEAATAGRVRLDDPEGDPRTHHHHEQRSVNL